jgi:hypothetical protein
MAKKKMDLRQVLKDAHAHFFLLKGDETIRLRLWEIKEDCIIIDLPKSIAMRRTVLGLIPTIDGAGVFEIEGQVDSETSPDEMSDTLRLRVDSSKVRKVNRRVFPRISFTPPVDVVIVAEGSDKAVVGKVINLSAGGLRVETLEELPPDKKLTFKFEIELDDEVHVLSPAGIVVYEVPSDAGHAYGVKFTGEKKAFKKDDEADIESMERTVDLMTLVNRLLVRQ